MTPPILRTSALLAAVLVASAPATSWSQPLSLNRTNHSVSGAEVEGFRLAIITSNRTYVAGHLVPVEICLENLSTNAARISDGTGLMCYSLQMVSFGGLPTPLTAYGTNMLQPLDFRRWTSEVIPAGKSYSRFAALNLLFDMVKPGEYALTVRRQVPTRKAPHREISVCAGPLKIVVTKPEERP